ncbi:MAG TPA: CHAD domain-containing protein [Steroidobacteraceae bacterium]
MKQSLLDMPVEQALRRLVHRHLAAAARGLERAQDPDDHKGLHGFRVAIRRLRSLLRAYRPWFGRAAGRKPRHRLRELTRATNEARDAHVQLTWLARETASLDREDRPGVAWMRKKLRGRRRGASRPAIARLARNFTHATELLERRLGQMKHTDACTFRSAFGEVFEPAADRFRSRLAAITGPGDYRNIHRTRIQVKRLRYLVEPLRREIDEARAVDLQLRKLQQQLGELHDIQVLETELGVAVEDAASEKARHMHELAVTGAIRRLTQTRRRDEVLGLLVLAGRARAERDALYEEFDRAWLTDRAAAFDRDLRKLSESLRPDDLA